MSSSDGSPIDLSISDRAWVVDTASPDFLGLTGNMLFYRADRTSPAILDDFSWPQD